jgi:hypothetical protein
MLSLKIFVRNRAFCTIIAIIIAIVVLADSPADATPVSVRFSEGVTHGYLLVRSLAGETIGRGELTQVVKEEDLVESHLVFRFKDGSLHDERVAFSQKGVFTLIRYHLIQRGPSFPEKIEVVVDRGTGEYTVRSQSGEGSKEEVLAGHVDLPADVYNGMIVMLLKNLPQGANETVNILAFSPAPEVIQLQLLAKGEQTVQIGEGSGKAMQYVFKPEIGKVRKFFGKIFGKLPDHFHYKCWIMVDEVPAFVEYEGPLQLMGPIVRIEVVNPRLSARPEDKKLSAN